jgi:hypothetical protein
VEPFGMDHRILKHFSAAVVSLAQGELSVKLIAEGEITY